MLTGGEPLLHGNLWALCDLLREEEIEITLVTTGLLLAPHATAIARTIGELVVSIDGPPDVHDEIRHVKDGFHRIARGLQAVLAEPTRPTIIARSVVQRANHEPARPDRRSGSAPRRRSSVVSRRRRHITCLQSPATMER